MSRVRFTNAMIVLMTGCAPTVDRSVRVPEPPADVTHVGFVVEDGSGKWVNSSPLLPRGETHPFSGTIDAAPDGHTLRLVGFTEEQLATCTPRPLRDLVESVLTPVEQRILALPEPAWVVAGDWQSGFVDLATGTIDRPFSSDWVAGGVDSCAAHDVHRTDRLFEAGENVVDLFVDADGRTATILESLGIYSVDIDTLDVTLLRAFDEDTGPSGGFVDASQRKWIFYRDGRLERWDPDGTVAQIASDGMWEGDVEVFASGGRADESSPMEIFLLASTGTIARWTPDTIEILGTVETRSTHVRVVNGESLWRGPGDAVLVIDSSLDVLFLEPHRVRRVAVGDLDSQAPIAVRYTERYGLVVSTRLGGVYASHDDESWDLIVPPQFNRAAYSLFEIGDGLFFGGHRGEFRYLYRDLPVCGLRQHADFHVVVAAQAGSRLLLVQPSSTLGGQPTAKLIALDIEERPVGCER